MNCNSPVVDLLWTLWFFVDTKNTFKNLLSDCFISPGTN